MGSGGRGDEGLEEGEGGGVELGVGFWGGVGVGRNGSMTMR